MSFVINSWRKAQRERLRDLAVFESYMEILGKHLQALLSKSHQHVHLLSTNSGTDTCAFVLFYLLVLFCYGCDCVGSPVSVLDTKAYLNATVK
ncbi:hypothetical protein CK203_095037 [Vitis vinifera]|uniref:Uncharacterized protein n=1 Tax=Vitis vinifera TaxID=29760 RepID=A0A438C710_VITVI|nr:hypothetical protein CK203_095037 [Vitis vinifera]